MQDSLSNNSLITSTVIKNIKFSRCKCLGGMFGPLRLHNSLFYCQYKPQQLKNFLPIQTIMQVFQPLYSHPVLKIQRLFTFLLYALTIYLSFYTILSIVLLSVGEVEFEWISWKFQIQAVLYFMVLVTIGMANQFLFHYERKLIEQYINSLNRAVLRNYHLYITLKDQEQGCYFCKYSFRLLNNLQIKKFIENNKKYFKKLLSSKEFYLRKYFIPTICSQSKLIIMIFYLFYFSLCIQLINYQQLFIGILQQLRKLFRISIVEMSKKKTYTSSHSLSPSQHKSQQGTFSSQNTLKQVFNSNQIDSEIYEFNFKVLSREPQLRNIQKILYFLNFVNLARYQPNGNYWNYLKVKGPMFVVIDRYSQIKIVILNQCSTENQIIHIQKQMKFQLKNLEKDGYLLNYCIEDSITGTNIYGIWTADKNIEKVWQHLQQYLNMKW